MVALGVVVVGLGPASVSAGDAARLAQGFAAPIVEGASLGGVRLGSSEAEVVAALGVPEQVGSSRPGAAVPLKVALYRLGAPPTVLRVVFREGRVEAALVVTFDLSRPPLFTGRARGVGLGSKIRAVRNAYGPGTGGRLWYPALGIASNPQDKDQPDEDPVYAILVTRPGFEEHLVDLYGRVIH